LVNVGNLIDSADTVLASIVQLDPIYLYFSPSESEYLEILAHYGGGEITGKLAVSMILRDNRPHPHDGLLDFVDNTVDATTGTLAMRAVIANPDKTLRPGQFAKARVTLTEKTNAVLVPEESIASDQGGNFVMIVGNDDKVEKRSVNATVRFENMRVIDAGVEDGERVIVQGLQKVQPGQTVDPKPVKASAPATRTGQEKA
jgi:RND family efflux transporter MFP subunit